ncbi:MAG: 50S ribosomal protein L1 [bacterium]
MSKRILEITKLVDKNKLYPLQEAVGVIKKAAKAKFDETVEVHIKLGIDPKQSDQGVRGTVNLPHGTGKSRKVAVVAAGEKLKEAESNGADICGGDDLIEKIAKGWMDFDVLVATPDNMRNISKLGKVLGPRGLMPNPKSGTVTFDIASAIKEIKAGRVEFKNDIYGNIHCAIGKASFSEEHLVENLKYLVSSVIRLKPASSKGIYIRKISLSSTMGPGIAIDPSQKFS